MEGVINKKRAEAKEKERREKRRKGKERKKKRSETENLPDPKFLLLHLFHLSYICEKKKRIRTKRTEVPDPIPVSLP